MYMGSKFFWGEGFGVERSLVLQTCETRTSHIIQNIIRGVYVNVCVFSGTLFFHAGAFASVQQV